MSTKPTIAELQWADSDIIDPVSGQANKVNTNASKKTAGWIFKEKPPFQWFNYWMNGVYQWLKDIMENTLTIAGDKTFSDDITVSGVLTSKIGRGSTIVIASSTSQSSSKAQADYVLSGADVGGQINTIISTLSAAGGGEIKFMEGTYLIQTNILPLSNVNIMGCGSSTVFKRNSTSLIQVIYITDIVDNIKLESFKIDGNKSGFVVAADAYGILFQSAPTSLTFVMRNVKLINIESSNTQSSTGISAGFKHAFNLINCRATNNIGIGFSQGINFYVSIYLSQCSASGTSTSSDVGFDTCWFIDNCYSTSTLTGFNSCVHINKSLAYANGGGFGNSNYITTSKSISNTANGFNSCEGVNLSLSSSNGQYGFNACKGLQHNKTSGNTSGAYNSSYVDWATGTAAANTSAGGWNI